MVDIATCPLTGNGQRISKEAELKKRLNELSVQSNNEKLRQDALDALGVRKENQMNSSEITTKDRVFMTGALAGAATVMVLETVKNLLPSKEQVKSTVEKSGDIAGKAVVEGTKLAKGALQSAKNLTGLFSESFRKAKQQ